MEANGKASKNGEISVTDNNIIGEVVLNIFDVEKNAKNSPPDALKDQRPKVSVDSPQRVSIDSHSGAAMFAPMSCPSPEIVGFSPSANSRPKIPTTENLIRRKSLARSVYSKPNSRFGEQPVLIDSNSFEEKQEQIVSTQASPNSKMRSYSNTTQKETIRMVSLTPKALLMGSPCSVGGEDEDKKIYEKVNIKKKLKNRRMKMQVLNEWIIFLCILGCLVASLTVSEIKEWMIFGLPTWKWILLVMVTFSGMMVTKWLVHIVVFFIELNFLFREKVLYFVHGVKKSVQVFIWLSLVLVTWVLLIKEVVERTHAATRVLDYITWTIVSLLIGTFLWLLKTTLLKMLASSFHVSRYFDRILESIFHQYIVQTLSGPPVMESAMTPGRTNSTISQLTLRTGKGKEKKEKEVININQLRKMKPEKVSSWTMKVFVDVISRSGLPTISSALESDYDGEGKQKDKEITTEENAIASAYHIFMNVAQPGSKYIDEIDLRRFMTKEQVDLVFPMIDVAETGTIDRKALAAWVVKVYNDRKALAHALNDAKTAIEELNKLVIGILIVIMIIVWLLLMEIATTNVLVFLSSQLVVAAFVFGNSCKTVFEAIIFVCVMHPFDVGDRCVVDGVQLIVEEMNILTTVFLRYDNEKIYYPNSVLATKPISNFYRSPDMGDSFEFSIDFRTQVEKIGELKEKIKQYLDKNPQHWYPNHSVVVKEIENVNKIKMALYFNHKMNFQEFGEKNLRRSELVLEMKKIFEELSIRYDLLPQDVHLL